MATTNTVARNTDNTSPVTAAFQLGIDAGRALETQHQRLTALLETTHCALPDCVADHQREECCHTALATVGPASTGITYDPQRGWSMQMDLGCDPELLDLEETARFVRNVNRQFRHMLTQAGAR